MALEPVIGGESVIDRIGRDRDDRGFGFGFR